MQTGIEAWVDGVKPRRHNHAFDVFWERRGLVPPCKLKPTDPEYEVSE